METQSRVPVPVRSTAFVQAWYLRRRQPAPFILLCVLLTLTFYHLLTSARAVASVAQPSLAVVSAASGEANALAPNSLATAYGVGLASDSFSAPVAGAPPTELGGTRLAVTDSSGVERFAQLLLVSPTQINFLLPAGMANGNARVTVRNGGNVSASQTINVQAVAPAFFTLDGSGRGVPSGFLLRVKSTGQQLYEPLAQYDETAQRNQPRALDLGPEGEQVFLVLFLTGLGNAVDPNGDGNLNETVKLLIGGTEVPVVFVGKQNEYGLDQLNALIPRRLSGRGSVKLAVAVTGAPASNLTDIEIGAPTGNNPPVITGFSANAVLAGQSLEITGSGFSANASDNFVRFVGNNPPTVEAEASAVTANKMTVNVPFGAGTGAVYVGNAQGLRPSALPSVRTSVSGFVQNTQRVAIPGLLVRVRDTNITTTTNADGTFVLADVPPGQRVEVEIDSPTSKLPYPLQKLSMLVVPNRDNQINRTELGPTNGIVINVPSAAGQTFSVAVERAADPTLAALAPAQTNITIDIAGRTVRCPDGNANCPLTLTAFAAGRTPVDLPVGHFSSVIAQLTPFGATIAPGAKLIFPNTDRIPAGAAVRLFKLDQTPGSESLGSFVDIGAATVTADGQRIETAPNAITEASYYFVSMLRPTAALSGHVSEADGRPVRRAIVAARGQSTFTDGNGGFVLRNLPVLAANDQVIIEASFQRPDGTISRAQSNPLGITTNSLTFIPADLTLPPRTSTTGPKLLMPTNITMTEGETPRDFNFLATGLAAGVQPTLVSPPTFAMLRNLGNDAFALRLAPPLGSAGNYQLTIAIGSAPTLAQQTVAVNINPANASIPTAQVQAITTDEDMPKQITLTSANAGGAPSYSIVTPPLHGTLSGTPPNVIYNPAVNYNGTDSFSFRVGSGNDPRSIGIISLLIRPINDPPIINSVFNPQTLSAGQLLNLRIVASDPDGDQLTCTAPNAPAGVVITPEQAAVNTWRLTWTPVFTQVNRYTINLTVTDAGVPQCGSNQTTPCSDTEAVTVVVNPKWASTSGPEGGEIQSLIVDGATVYAGTSGDGGDGVYRSTDWGTSWTRVSNGFPANTKVYALGANQGRLVAATSSYDPVAVAGIIGVYYSPNAGQDWLRSNLNVSIVSFTSDDTGAFYAGGLGGVYRSTNGGQTWNALNGPGNRLTVNSLASIGGVIFAGTDFSGIFRLSLNGQWAQLGVLRTPEGFADTSIRALVVEQGVLYAATFDYVYRSQTQGASWTRLHNVIPPGQGIATLMVNNQTVYVVTDQGGVHQLASDGQRWLPLNNNLPFSQTGFTLIGRNSVFLAATSKGVYRSMNAGQNWSPSNTGIVNSTIYALGVQGQNLFAGARENGIYRSTNRGQSWMPVGLGTQTVNRIFVIGDNVYANATLGFYLSRDNGATWVLSNNGLPSPVTGLVVFRGAWFASFAGSFYRSDNQGQNWRRVFVLPGSSTVTSLLVSNDVLYAGVSTGRTSGNVYRSQTGEDWTATGLSASVNALAEIAGDLFAGASDGVSVLRVQQQNWVRVNNGLSVSGRVAEIRSLATVGTGLYAGSRDGIFFSNDHGQSWLRINDGLNNTFVEILKSSPSELYLGTSGGGVSRLGNNTQSWDDSNANLPVNGRSTNTLAVKGANLFLGALGGGVFRSTDQGTTWTAVNNGLPTASNVLTLATNDTLVLAGTAGAGVFRSANDGNNWAEFNTGLPTTTSNPQQNPRNLNALRFSGTALLAATDAGVFRLNNPAGVSNWSATNLTRTTLSLLVNDATFYAGTLDDGVYRSTDGGQAWQPTGKQGLNNLTIRALGLSADGNSLLAGTDAGIYRSTNQGQSWTPVVRDLPANLVVTAFVTSGANLFAGSVYGVFLSENNGDTWQQVNAGLFNVYVTSFALSGNRLIAGTKVGGVFSSQIPEWASCLGISTPPASQTIASGGRATLNVTPSGDQPFQFQWYRGASGDLSQPIAGATASRYVTPNLTATTNYWVRITNGCGSVNSETASVIVNATPQTDLSIAQTVTPEQAVPGAHLTYTFTLNNNGSSDAFSITVTDLLPSAVSYSEGSCVATGGGVCGGVGNNRLVAFPVLRAGATATITLAARVTANAAGTINNVATISASIIDTNPANNRSEKSVTVQGTTLFISSLDPSTALVGSAGFSLTVNGSGFVNNSVVRWNGADRPTTFVSAAQLRVQLPASDIANVGTASVTVFNPPPNSGTSNPLNFAITRPCFICEPFSSLPAQASLNGTAVYDATKREVRLTPDEINKVGTIFFTPTTLIDRFTASFQLRIDGQGADGMTFAVIESGADSQGMDGGWLGYEGIAGRSFAVEFDTYRNPEFNDPLATPHVGLNLNGSVKSIATGALPAIQGQGNLTVRVIFERGNLQIFLPDKQAASVLNATIPNWTPFTGRFGFTAATGGLSQIHVVSSVMVEVQNAPPLLTSLSPNSIIAGGAGLTLTVNGSGFVNGSVVRWQGSDRATTFVSGTQLTATIPASDIASAGSAQVTVFNPASGGGGGGLSNALSFTINQPPNPVPTVAALNPNVATAGGAAFTLTVTGASFVNGATVQWNGSARPTSFVNSAQLTAALPASDLATAGTANVTVFNPANAGGGGGVSNPLVFTINQPPNPAPTLTSLNPNAAMVGGAAFTLTVNGTGFINASAIRWNGQERLTNFINSSQLTTQIPASDLANTGTAQVTVFNPASTGGGGGASNALTFTISPAVNALANVSAASYRNTAFAGESIAAAFGTNLATRVEVANTLPLPTSLAGTSVRVKDSVGTERLAQLFFVAPSQINYLIPAGLANGTATVTVTAGDGVLSAGQVQLATVAPGLFTANANGQGVPAALVLRVAANGAQAIEPVARFDATLNAFVPVPLDLGPPTDQLFLILYGTGMRGLGSLSAATATLGGVNLPVLFVGAVDGLAGLDQVNLGPLPRTLVGRGNLDLVLLLNSQAANTVQLNVK